MFSASLQHPRRIGVGGYGTPLESTLLQELLTAAGAHDEWRHQTHMGRGPQDLARQHSENDKAFHEVVARVKDRLAKYTEPEAACFEPEMARAVLEGRKTVSRWPVETTKAGEFLSTPFKVGGGPGGSYALKEFGGSGGLQPTDGYRLRVLDIELGTVERLCLDEVRLEGFESRLAHRQYWNNVRLENDLFGLGSFRELLVWRYEFELIEL